MKARAIGRIGRIVGLSLAAMLLLGWLALRLLPLPKALLEPPAATPTYTDRNGASLREVLEEERFSKPVSIDEVPARLVQAVLAAEDKRFFAHGGVDCLAAGRALWNAALGRTPRSGASTITQQLVKIAQPRPRTWRTKLIEAAYAMRLEQRWSKRQILEAYLNRLDFGHLNIGINSAAGFYFGKPLADLTEAEAAFLAGLPKNPTLLNPHRHRAAAFRRQQTVLRRMHKAHWLAADHLSRALAEPLRLRPARRAFAAPHFVDLIRKLEPGGQGSVRTTLDVDLQGRVEALLRARVAALRAQHVQNGAAVVIENATGDVLALAGSEDYFATGAGQVNGAWARRSPGSALKPFTYLLALERGATPATVIADVPALFLTSTGLYRPENFHRRCSGPVRFRMALANSLNIPAVNALSSIGGPAPLRDLLAGWGLTTLEEPAEHYGLGLTLGNAEVRLLELANAYAALARLGQFRPYRLTETLASPHPRIAQTPITAANAWLLADMLSDNEARALAFGRQSALRFDFPVACKTGTSTDFRDNCAFGYTPEFTVGVWVGNFDGSSMRDVSGVTGAAPLMHEIMEHLHRRFGTSWYGRPAEIVDRAVHPITGKLLTKPRADGIREKFRAAGLPATENAADYDSAGRPILPNEYRAWLASPENTLASTAGAEPPWLRIISPIAGTTFILNPDLPSSRRIPLKAEGPGALTWQSETLPCLREQECTVAEAREGRHRIVVTDSAGSTAETWITIRGS